MRKDRKTDRFLPYVTIMGIVAIVAIVSLFLWGGRVEGAPIRSYVEDNQVGCLDDDPLNDFYKAGTVRQGKTQFDDYCLNGKLLFQHHCLLSNSVRLLAPYECPGGCSEGVCRG